MLDRPRTTSADKQRYQHYFYGRDRFEAKCPDCKQGVNSRALGGSDRCFHCDNCGLIECFVTSPDSGQ